MKRTNWKKIAKQLADAARPVLIIIDGHVGIVWSSNLRVALERYDEAVHK